VQIAAWKDVKKYAHSGGADARIVTDACGMVRVRLFPEWMP